MPHLLRQDLRPASVPTNVLLFPFFTCTFMYCEYLESLSWIWPLALKLETPLAEDLNTVHTCYCGRLKGDIFICSNPCDKVPFFVVSCLLQLFFTFYFYLEKAAWSLLFFLTAFFYSYKVVTPLSKCTYSAVECIPLERFFTIQ